MGLGLFLAREVLGRLEGNLELDSVEGRGTTAIVTIPTGVAATSSRTGEPFPEDPAKR
jgi:signal transduction histidine kinase